MNLDEQATTDTCTIADVKQFIADCRKKKDNWQRIAERSWREVKKRNENNKLYGGNNLDIARRWSKYPLWWSAWKIRQPITLARLPVPILKDTQGDDPIGRTACVVGERLIRGILKTFDAFTEFCSANDDFLITNFGWGRAFYRIEECLEDEKLRLQTIEPPMPEPVEGQPPPQPQAPIVVGPDGVPVQDFLTDEFGPYILTGQKVTIENEEVYFESGLYCNLFVDPWALRWNKVDELAFEYSYSYRQFEKKFGAKALESIATRDLEDHRSGKKPIIVFEYYNKTLKEVRWFAENSEDFFQPSEIADVGTDELKEIKEKSPRDNSDLYGLTNFFPCTSPLLVNQSTDEFWPVPEYFQMADIIEDVHSIVSRMILLTKAIRVRFLFDKSVPELKQLIQETGEAGGLGVSNLAQALMNGKGTLSTLVAYFPVAEMIEGLENMYKAFNQRLDMFFRATGLNDLLQGQSDPNADKTFGERQMEGKYAMNRMEPFQRKIQEWIKDNYQLLMEMGLKMFSDETLDKYITPQTLDEEDKQRYEPSLELLRSNKRARFRVDFETDSTIAINEQWRKNQAIEAANIITKMQESIAKTAEAMPELAESQLKVMQHVIGELTDGKLFMDEVIESIESVIDKVNQPKPPEFNADEAKAQLEAQRFQFDQARAANEDNLEAQKLQLEMQKLQATTQLEQLQMQMNQQTEAAKIQSEQAIASLNSQIEQLKLSVEQQAGAAELEQSYQKIAAEIGVAREELALKRDELLVELRKVTDKKEMDEFGAMIDARVVQFEEKLLTSEHELESMKTMLDEKEKYATEARLQQEHQLDKMQAVMDIALKKKELDAPMEGEKTPSKSKPRKSKIVRDKNDKISEIIHED